MFQKENIFNFKKVIIDPNLLTSITNCIFLINLLIIPFIFFCDNCLFFQFVVLLIQPLVNFKGWIGFFLIHELIINNLIVDGEMLGDGYLTYISIFLWNIFSLIFAIIIKNRLNSGSCK